MTHFFQILGLICLVEVGIILTITYFRKEFQWLITKQDEYPQLDPKSLEKFLNTSYDPDLGWVRKPNTTGIEKSGDAQSSYSIDALGSRTIHRPQSLHLATLTRFAVK
jgi:hypothetical protein